MTKCNTCYYKMRQLFYYKMRQKLITKCESYYELRQLYYKMRQFLQNATFIRNYKSTTVKTLLSDKIKLSDKITVVEG